MNFSYYGAFIWLPSLLVASGLDLVRSFGYTLVITLAQLPGYALAAVLVEVWGRRPTLSVFLAGSAGSAGLRHRRQHDDDGGRRDGAVVLQPGRLGRAVRRHARGLPDRDAGDRSGWAAGFGRIASILAPLSVPLLREGGDNVLVFTVFAGFFLLAAGAAWGLPERRGEPMDAPV